MKEKTKVLTAKNMLPPDIGAAVHLAVKNCNGNYEAFRTELRSATQYLIDHGAIAQHETARNIHPLADADESLSEAKGPGPGGEWEELPPIEAFPAGTFASPEAKENYILVMNRFAQRRQRQAGARRSA